jgi:hypothetical protein
MQGFKLAFGIISGVGLGMLLVGLVGLALMGVHQRYVETSESEARFRMALATLAAGKRADAVEAFVGGKIDEDLLFDLARKIGVVQEDEEIPSAAPARAR